MIRSIEWLKTKFKQGSRPQQTDYEDVFDTYLPRVEYQRDQKYIVTVPFEWADTNKIDIENNEIVVPIRVLTYGVTTLVPIEYDWIESDKGVVVITGKNEIGTKCILIGCVIDISKI